MDRKLIRDFKVFLKDVVDLRDTCCGGPNHRMSNRELEWWRNHPKEGYRIINPDGTAFDAKVYRPSMPTYADFNAHLNGYRDTTIFVANSYRQRLLCLADIDNKDGDGNPEACAQRVLEHLGGEGYVEQSTGRSGRHVYFMIDTCGFTCAEVRRRLAQFDAHMSADPYFARFGCKMDAIFGLPTLWRKEGELWKVIKRGNELRLPWLDGLESGDASLAWLKALSPRPLTAIKPPDPEMAQPTKRIGKGREKTGSSICKQNVCQWFLRGNESLVKMNGSAWSTALKLGRAPTSEEILAVYETSGLGTGEDHDRNRRRLAEQNEQYLAARFKPATVGFEGRRQSLCKLVSEAVSPEVRERVSNRNRVAYNDVQLAMVLHCVECVVRKQQPGKLAHTLPINYILQAFEESGIELAGTRRTKAMRISAMKHALTEAGLISPLDGGNYWPGVAKKFALGQKHPLRMTVGFGCSASQP